MIDTHAHLTSPAFSEDLHHVLSRARSAGVSSIICVSESLADARQVLGVSAEHSGLVHAALGLHPEHVSTLTPAELSNQQAAVTQLLIDSPVVAIGEVGLDHTPRVLASASDPEAGKQSQAETFAHFLELSQQLGLPVSVHSRGAGRRALELVAAAAERGNVAVCMHAFDGRAVYAERGLQTMKEGLYFSVPPSVTRSPQFVKLVQRIPIERLLLESDAPVLGPSKDERNEPRNIVKSAETIAAVKGIDVARVRETLLENTLRLFPKAASG